MTTKLSDQDIKVLISDLKANVTEDNALIIDIAIESGKIMNDRWAPYFMERCSCGARDKEKCHKESSSGYGKLCCKATKSS